MNLRSHGVSFEEAALVFSDRLASTSADERHEYRWMTVGEVAGQLLVVIHSDDEETINGQLTTEIRIISARFATAAETRAYREEPG